MEDSVVQTQNNGRRIPKGELVLKKYRIEFKLGSGTFGDVYRAEDIATGVKVAIKIESKIPAPGLILQEYNLYLALQGQQGIAQVYLCETDENRQVQVLIMELLGDSLDSLLTTCGRRFSFPTALQLGMQMIDRIELLHKYGYVHRDIKPQNFVMGCNEKAHIVHLIDYGLAKPFWDSSRKRHIPDKFVGSFVGTVRYASIHAHQGRELSRRDDLLSLGYMLVKFILGYLPWQNIKAFSKVEKLKKVYQKKLSSTPEILCKNLPTEIFKYMHYCYKLRYTTTPNYNFLRNNFKVLLNQYQSQNGEHDFDWIQDHDSETSDQTNKS
ncbi:casein kinase I-like [Anopheles bellator]|uniref:casein kinase I-like n=1 Tax=Anopheles bellator TaxID=139047 RepID=UPI0026498768|nr:casein kinase I-like [Anopheles bellator]